MEPLGISKNYTFVYDKQLLIELEVESFGDEGGYECFIWVLKAGGRVKQLLKQVHANNIRPVSNRLLRETEAFVKKNYAVIEQLLEEEEIQFI